MNRNRRRNIYTNNESTYEPLAYAFLPDTDSDTDSDLENEIYTPTPKYRPYTFFSPKETALLGKLKRGCEFNIPTNNYRTNDYIENKAIDEIITKREIIRFICSRHIDVDGKTDNRVHADTDSVLILRNDRLKNTIRHLKQNENAKIKITGKKEVLIQRLIDYYNVRNECLKHRNSLAKFKSCIQQFIKNKPKYSWQFNPEPYNNKELCINDDDPISCYELKEIEEPYFYVIKEGKYYYGFDVRSLFGIIYHTYYRDHKNPLTRKRFSSQVYKDLVEKLKKIKRQKKTVFEDEENEQNHTTQPQSQTVITNNPREELSNTINALSYDLYSMDYHVNEEQLQNLTLNQTREIFSSFFTIWNYNLNNQMRRQFEYNQETNESLVVQSIRSFYNIRDPIIAKLKMLNIFKQIISNPERTEDRKTGAIYVMISLCSTNSNIRESYPQFVNIIGGDI